MSKSAEIAEIIYEYAALPDWTHLDESGAEMPINTPICFATRWTNTGTEQLQARVYFKVTDPDGDVGEMVPDLYYATLDPDQTTWIYFDNVVFSAAGEYSVEITVVEYGQMVALDTVIIPITVGEWEGDGVPPPSNGDVVPPGTQSLIGFVVAIGIMAAMVGMMTTSMSKEM